MVGRLIFALPRYNQYSNRSVVSVCLPFLERVLPVVLPHVGYNLTGTGKTLEPIFNRRVNGTGIPLDQV